MTIALEEQGGVWDFYLGSSLTLWRFFSVL